MDSVSWSMSYSQSANPAFNSSNFDPVVYLSIDRVGGSYVGSVNTDGVGPGAGLWPIHVNDDSSRISWGPSPVISRGMSSASGYLVAAFASNSVIVPAGGSFSVSVPAGVIEYFWQDDKVSQTNGSYGFQLVTVPDVRYFGLVRGDGPSDGTWVELKVGTDGRFTLSDTYALYGLQVSVPYAASAAPRGTQLAYCGYDQFPTIYVFDDGVVTAIEGQTDALTSTEGSDSIVSGVTDGGEQGLLDRFGFLGQTVGWVGDIFSAFQTTNEQSTLSFSGVTVDLWGHAFTFPAFSVDLWESCPVLEVPCRTFTTCVAVLLWVKGMYAAWQNFLSTGHWGLPDVHVESDAE